MRAGAHQLTNLTGSDDLEALLALAKDNELRYEYLDQDASIRHTLSTDEIIGKRGNSDIITATLSPLHHSVTTATFVTLIGPGPLRRQPCNGTQNRHASVQ